MGEGRFVSFTIGYKDSDLWIGIFSATSQKIQTYVVCVPDDIFHRGE